LRQGVWEIADERQFFAGLLYHKQTCLLHYLEIALQATDLTPKKEDTLRRATLPWMSRGKTKDVEFSRKALSGLMRKKLKITKIDGLMERPAHKAPKPRKRRKYASKKFSLDANPKNIRENLGLDRLHR
jgi:hypothetical protein